MKKYLLVLIMAFAAVFGAKAQNCTNGTLVFKEDFGGNSPSDPLFKATGIPEVVDYTYLATLNGQGVYSIGKRTPYETHNTWYNIDDHTYPNDASRGYLLCCDAATYPGQIYQCTINNLCTGTQLYFSAWIVSLINDIYHNDKANLKFRLETPAGVLLTEYATGNIPDANPNWQQYGVGFTITNPAVTSIVLKILNNGTGSGGNDFAIDDIEIRLCVPPVIILAENTVVCLGDDVSIPATFDNQGVFQTPLSYKWFYSAANDLTNPASWSAVVPAAVGQTLNITNATVADAGYYRLAVSGPGSIDNQNCRAMSNSVRLTVNKPDTTITTASICEGDSALFAGRYYTMADTYYITENEYPANVCYTNITSCNRTRKFVLDVKPTPRKEIDSIVCGSSYEYKGTEYFESRTFRDTIASGSGCDSIFTINIVLNAMPIAQIVPSAPILTCSQTTATLTASGGTSYIWKKDGEVVGTGATYSTGTAGTYWLIAENAGGCKDSISAVVSQNTVPPTADIINNTGANIITCLNPSISITAIGGGTYSWSGGLGNAANATITQAGTYMVTVTAANGCTDTESITIAVDTAKYELHKDTSVCANAFPFAWHNKNINAQGTYYDSLLTQTGRCDSVYILNVTQTALQQKTLDTTLCYGSIFSFNRKNYSISGTYRDTIAGVNCDTAFVLNVTILPDVVRNTIDTLVCFNDAFAAHNDTLKNTLRCDSIVTIYNVNRLPDVVRNTIDTLVCFNDAFAAHNDTLKNTLRCDSIVTIYNVNRLPDVVRNTIDTLVCFNDAFVTHNDTLKNSLRCDSIVTIYNVIVLPKYEFATNKTVCENALPFEWRGKYLTETKTYYDSLKSVIGHCDSVFVLNLTIKNVFETQIDTAVCQNKLLFQWRGKTINAFGNDIKRDTLISSINCDSILILNVFAKPLSDTLIKDTICYGKEYHLNGFNITNPITNTYTLDLTNIHDCDSIVTLNLFVAPLPSPTITPSVTTLSCAQTSATLTANGGGAYLWSTGETTQAIAVTSQGTYKVIVTNEYGCVDSVSQIIGKDESMPIAVINASNTLLTCTSTSITLTASGGIGYSWNTGANTAQVVVTEPNTYSVIVTAANGCTDTESIIITQDTAKYSFVENDTICQNNLPYAWRGQDYFATNTYYDSLKTSVGGCDSVYVLNLVVVPVKYFAYSHEICKGTSYAFGGNNLSVAGIYKDTITLPLGCDSIVTLTLKVNQTYNDTINASICIGETYTLNNFNENAEGYYTQPLSTIDGCDSIVTLHLVVNLPTDTLIKDTICANQLPYTLNGFNVSTAGSHQRTINNATGCDSIIYLQLFVAPIFNDTIRDTICKGGNYNLYDLYLINVQSSFIQTHIERSIFGCDSLFTLDLFVKLPTDTLIKDTICANQLPYTLNGFNVSTAGNYQRTINNATGCDSVIYLQLFVAPILNDTIRDTICKGENYTLHGFNLINVQSSFIQTHTETSKYGCDSLFTLNLVVRTAPAVEFVTPYEFCIGDSVKLHFTGTAPFVLDYSINGTAQPQITIYGSDTAFVQNTAGTFNYEVISLTDINGCLGILTGRVEHGVLINGVCWATRNVGTVGTFVDNPEDAGMCYQWNSKVYWSASDPMVDSNGNTVWNSSWDGNNSPVWNNENNPCPAGWRIPSHADFQTLIDANSIWTNVNGVAGREFGNGANTIFIPAVGYRISYDGIMHYNNIYEREWGFYWGNVSFPGSASCLHINSTNAYNASTIRADAVRVRCVAENIPQKYIVNAPTDMVISDTICAGEEYHRNGFDILNPETNIYTTNNLHNAHGCDSTATLHLFVAPIFNDKVLDTICKGENYTLHGFNLTNVQSSLIQTHTETSKYGCDSLFTLNLVVNLPTDTLIKDTICANQLPYILNGFNVSTAGDYQRTINNVAGCDSVINLQLFIAPAFNDTISAAICLGETYNQYNFNETPSVAGLQYFYQNLHTAQLCDSIVTLKLLVNQPTSSTIVAAICADGTYTLNGFNESTAGTYQRTTTNTAGCDSVIYLQLSVNQPTSSTIVAAICAGGTYTFNGFNESTAGTYQRTTTNAAGCDSTIYLQLSVNQPTSSTITAIICEGATYTLNGFNENAAGNYQRTTTNTAGCDSVIILNLSVAPTYNNAIYDTICYGGNYNRYNFNLTNVESAAVATQRLTTAAAGCDSIVTLYLEVVALPNVDVAIPQICADDKSFTLKIAPEGNYTDYSITFYNPGVPAGFDIFASQHGAIDGDEIEVEMPAKIYPAHYKFTLTLTNINYNCGAKTIADEPFDVLYPDSIMKQKWDDVIALTNAYYNGGYKYTGYQWYKNGIKMAGENYSYIYISGNGVLNTSDEYSVEIARADGSRIFSCPFSPHAPRRQISDYPIVVSNNGQMHIYIQHKNLKARLWTMHGKLLSVITLEPPVTTITAPWQDAVYLMEVFSDEEHFKNVIPVVVKRK